MSKTWIVDAIGRGPYDQLASELPGSTVQSIWLEVTRARAGARTPAEVLAQYERDLFVRPGFVDQRLAVEIDGHLLAAAAGFEAIELSPLTPLGTCTSVALGDQNRIVSALRGLEVVSDPTNAMTLEAATRLKKARDPVHLATCMRVVRAQPVPKHVGWSQTFRMFALASGGFETANHGFTVEAVLRHLRAMLAALDRFEQHGYRFGVRRIELLATPERAELADRIAKQVGADRAVLEHAYYSAGLRYKIYVTDPDGNEMFLVDGGVFDWLAKLLANRRAVVVASGTGAQLFPMFRATS